MQLLIQCYANEEVVPWENEKCPESTVVRQKGFRNVTRSNTHKHTHTHTHTLYCTVLTPLPERLRGPLSCRRGKGARRVATQKT